jgi:hypothetical protein
MNAIDLKGRFAVVTGGAQGIGLAVATLPRRFFRQEGFSICPPGRDLVAFASLFSCSVRALGRPGPSSDSSILGKRDLFMRFGLSEFVYAVIGQELTAKPTIQICTKQSLLQRLVSRDDRGIRHA